MNNLEMFRKLYWVAFCRPVLKTNKFNDIWCDLEGLSDWLAGPLYSIETNGNCNYVYTDEEGRFPGVDNPDKFLRWCLSLVDRYRDSVMKHKPKSPSEETDFQTLIQQIDVMEVLSHLAYRIQGEQKLEP